MSILAPPTLLELAAKNLLKNESLAIAALEELPKELFPPLFLAAFNEKSRNTLKAMVHAWPFACLPLGALMKGQEIQKETFQAVLDGIDALLVQEICSRKCKLQVLDLRRNAHQDFWTVWSKAEYDASQPPKKKQKVADDSWSGMKQTVAPMEVLVDLCLKEDTFDEVLDCLLEKVKEKKGLLRLLCRKLKIFAMPLHDIKVILKMVQLDSIQDVEVNCTWKLSSLGKFAPLVGQMFNLRRLLISHIHLLPCASPEQEEEWVGQFASQFLTLHHLQELYLDSISFLKGRMNQLLRCLSSPLETLSITNCLLTELDLEHMSLCTNLRKLKDLGLSSINLTRECVKSLGVLLEQACVSLQDLDLDDCGITDPEFQIILPALSRCTQLTTFSFCGNRISMVVLEKLLEHTVGLSNLSHVLYPAPLESYEDEQGTLNLGKLVHLHAKLKQLLQKFGRPGMLWFSANPCPHCGDRTFYDPEPILCPCYRST
ncbi:melanoma antigen preferentially expressed in tumors-like [Ochotona princeps]|uniref:melanoma antigen preferentially expressed in tumors-like n=1 Tax=Ochotona princeps TaxID=9978 RepID=UPI0027149446|nr:melanoma antigen preferentially expressed in tumors-like [Ochotona princeps]